MDIEFDYDQELDTIDKLQIMNAHLESISSSTPLAFKADFVLNAVGNKEHL